MPNYVRNVLIFKTPEDRKTVINPIISARTEDIDFEFLSTPPARLKLLTPYPKPTMYDIDCAKYIWDSGTYLQCKLDFDDMYKLAEQSQQWFSGKTHKQVVFGLIELLKLYGYCSESDWRRDNWGCSSNGYDCNKLDSYRYAFTTSWLEPYKFYEKLAEKFPNVEFEVDFATEKDSGLGCGIGIFRNGQYSSIKLKSKLDQTEKLRKYVWKTL